MNYGLPYKGSKCKIVDQIVPLFPRRTHLYDLFCGGGAVTHFAMLTNRFSHIHMNDINSMCTELFRNCLEGKYDNESRWISREDFYRLKDADPYIAFVWSFGNNLRDYIYGKDIEPFKKALHYVLYYRNNSLCEALGMDLGYICQADDIEARYKAIKAHFRPDRGGEISHYEKWKRIVAFRHTNTTRESGSSSATRHTDEETQWFSSKGNVSITNGDYQSVEILPDSVIYCDIPYHGTNVYDNENDFDYERFYSWAENQTNPVFISEYWMPEDRFKCIKEIHHISSICATKTNKVTERIFIPIKQMDNSPRQLNFFLP